MRRRFFMGSFLGGLMGFRVLLSSGGNCFPSPSVSSQNTAKSDILVKVLGTAQDGGIPQIGCFCTNCKQARKDPHFSRLISSLGILDLKNNKAFIIDTTPDLRIQYDQIHERLGRKKTGKKNIPDGILLTHAHIGHYPGLMFYGYESLSTQNLPVYCSKRMGDFLSNNGPWDQLVRLKNISLQAVDPQNKINLTENISVIPFNVPHRDEYSDTLGFKIIGPKKQLLYIPDIQSWEAWNRSIKEEVEQTDFALLDGTFFSPEELPGRDLTKIGHPFITTSLNILKDTVHSGKNKVFFTHLNHTNLALNPEGKERRAILEAGSGIASEGMEFFI
ncbi:MAG: MBL fold metallo-hydrolase [Candidatus Aminicenantes bacterium]|nr:MBL fold metallo-hydrolase [Candidatus Aminicenantes bacterium]